jgi:hypothetical protein
MFYVEIDRNVQYHGLLDFFLSVSHKLFLNYFMAYMGPSLTTSSYLNPGYRIYSIDGDYLDSYWVLDHRPSFEFNCY